MKTQQEQPSKQPVQKQSGQLLESESDGPTLAPPPFQLQASSSSPGDGGGKGPIQRKIGPDGDGKRVIKKGAGQTFVAHKRSDGQYDLYQVLLDGKEHFHSTVSADNDNYDILPASEQKSGMDLQDISFVTSQQDRRVYSDSAHQERADFSYSALSHSLDQFDDPDSSSSSSRKDKQKKRKTYDGAVSHGASLSLSDGRIILNPKLNATLQLVVAHLLKYQQFHTPAELKSADRQEENEWRSHELDQTREWLETLGLDALRQMLPRLESDLGTQRLREIWPAPLDIGFPPSPSLPIFQYSTNKAVFLMAKKTLLDAFLAIKKDLSKKGDPRSKKRRYHTEAMLGTVGDQDDGIVDDPEAYFRDVMKLKRSDSGNSLVPEDDSDDDLATVPEEYDAKDDVSMAFRKQRAVGNTIGLKTKMTNRSLLDDQMDMQEAKDSGAADRARALHERHLGVMDHLEELAQEKSARLGERYQSIIKMHTSYENKRKMLDKYKPEDEEEVAMEVWLEYDRMLEAYRQSSVGDLMQSGQLGALHGIGPKTVQSAISSGTLPAPPKPKSGKKKKATQKPKAKSKSSSSSVMVKEHEEESKHSGKKKSGMSIQDLAAQYGGTAQYGDNDGNNCLIFAIAFAMGVGRFSQRQAAQIRQGLLRQGLVGIDATGFLPGYGNVVDRIMQFLLADQLIMGGDAAQLTVTIDTVLPGIAPVVQGAGARHVTIIHDGTHFWWVKPN